MRLISIKVFLPFIIVFSLALGGVSSCRNVKSSRDLTKAKCAFVLDKNAFFWKKDSIGSNGFRSLAAQQLQNMECDLVRFPEKKVQHFFGTPNGKIEYNEGYIFRYQLTNLGYVSHPGQEYMDIIIDEFGFVNTVRFWKVDG